MKQWFKYKFGFINIDSENLYLTNSGNWSKTLSLTENNTNIENKNDANKTKYLGFIIAIIGSLVYLIFKNKINGKVGIGLLMSVIILGYKLYSYFKSEIGESFKIPLHKIQTISLKTDRFKINYINQEGVESIKEIFKIEEKGFLIMENLQKEIKKTSEP